ncbi:hypothetical protein CYY_007668 [Polysphondylium violaceum]|uniref:Uncharacterized protein n=1 Tax=Polysphondylium violaceum TaxID=133409 RepID=A0A8J4UXW1_9MYCE|nr:hypothetical protein CYY_007668 [Polysphondylium violaceum]
MCRRDVLLTGDDKEVDWWFITKVRGFGDTYLYFDSKMTSNTFLEGHYLRSKYSALGATLFPFTGDRVDDKKNFVSFVDYATSHNAKRSFSKFYEMGAHQKGIFGWTEISRTNWKGFYIDHSMPYFPQLFRQGTTFMNPPINFDPRSISNLKNLKVGIKNKIGLYFSYYGWKNPFFYRNLMPMDCSGCVKKFLLDNGQEKEVYTYHDKTVRIINKKKGVDAILKATNNLAGTQIEIDDVNPFSVVYTLKLKPSQHIFCLSIDTKVKFKDFMDHYKYVSDQGIVSNVHRVSDLSLPDIKAYVSLYDENDSCQDKDIAKIDRSKQAQYITKKIAFVGDITAETMINVNQDPKARGKDVWYGLIENGKATPKKEPYLDTDQTVYISTWSLEDKNAWWRSNGMNKIVLEPTFTAKVYDSEIKWKSNCQNDHSKIAFTGEKGHKTWNVCIGGGNLYTTAKQKDITAIKSSIVLCLKLDGLHQALTATKTGTWDGSKDKQDEIEYNTYKKEYDKLKDTVLNMEDGDYLVDFIETDGVTPKKVPVLKGYSKLLAKEFVDSRLRAQKLCQKLKETPVERKFSFKKLPQGMLSIETKLKVEKILFKNAFLLGEDVKRKSTKRQAKSNNMDDDEPVYIGEYIPLFKSLIPSEAVTEFNKQINGAVKRKQPGQ